MAAILAKKKSAVLQSATTARKLTKLSDKNVLELDAVIGTTSAANSVVYDPNNDIVAYAAGCVIVLAQPRKNKQIGYLISRANRKITSLSFSKDGKFLAAGDCGHTPAITVWDVSAQQVVVELKGQKFGIQCAAFSPNGKFLVSVGFQHDASLVLWDWRAAQVLAVHRLPARVHSAAWAEDSTFFVTAAQNGVRYWYLPASANAPTDVVVRKLSLETKSVVFNEQWLKEKETAFVSVAVAKDGVVYGLTALGLLVAFDSQRREPQKWVSLKVARGGAIAVSDKYVACACASGVVRLMHTATLQHAGNLPRPAPLPKAPSEESAADVFADAVSVQLIADNDRVLVLYADRNLLLYDVTKPSSGKLYRRLLQAHSDAVFDTQTYRGPAFPDGTFLTCSADGSVCFWNLEQPEPLLCRLSLNPTPLQPKSLDADSADNSPSEHALRCVKISPDGVLLASGDRQGNLRLHNLLTKQQVDFKEAHDSEVLALDFSPSIDSCTYLASGGRDRLMHVFNVTASQLQLVETHDDHSSSITAVRFARTDGVYRLISCSADKSVIFRSVQTRGGFRASRYHQAVGQYGSVFDVAIEPELDDTVHHQKHALCIAQDKKLTVYGIASGRVVRAHKLEPDSGEAVRLSVDRAGLLAATASTDRHVRLYDTAAGDLLGRVGGHSEHITALQFTADCRRLLSTSADGCVFVWRLPTELTQSSMQTRVAEKAFLFSESPLPAWARQSKDGTGSNAPPSRLTKAPALRVLGKWAARSGRELQLANSDVVLSRDSYRRLSGIPLVLPPPSVGTDKENAKTDTVAVMTAVAEPKAVTAAVDDLTKSDFLVQDKLLLQTNNGCSATTAAIGSTSTAASSSCSSSPPHAALTVTANTNNDAAEAPAVNPEEFLSQKELPAPFSGSSIEVKRDTRAAIDAFDEAEAEFTMFAPDGNSFAPPNARRLSISASFRSRKPLLPPDTSCNVAVPSAPVAESAPVRREETISAEVSKARQRLLKLGLLPTSALPAVPVDNSSTATPLPTTDGTAEMSTTAQEGLVSTVVSESAVQVSATELNVTAPVAPAATADEQPDAAHPNPTANNEDSNAEVAGQAVDGDANIEETAAAATDDTDESKLATTATTLEMYHEAVTKLEENFDGFMLIHQHLKERRSLGDAETDALLERFQALFGKMQERLWLETPFRSTIDSFSNQLVEMVREKLV